MASLYPAEFLGIAESVGRLAVGQRADLVLLDNQHQVLANYIAGNAVYVRP